LSPAPSERGPKEAALAQHHFTTITSPETARKEHHKEKRTSLGEKNVTRRKEHHKQEAEEAKDHISHRSTTLMFGM
jgi:hypothetical protein